MISVACGMLASLKESCSAALLKETSPYIHRVWLYGVCLALLEFVWVVCESVCMGARTDDSLSILGPGCAQSELAQLLLCLWREGI
jgi:hypothetical protein